MDAKTYAKVSALNLGFLAVGILVGMYLRSIPTVRAQEQQFENISPGITAPSMGVGTFLAGRIAADQVMIQGIDQLKFDENILNYLARQGVGTQLGWQSVISDSRVPRPLRMAQPQAPVVTPQAPTPRSDTKTDNKKGDAK